MLKSIVRWFILTWPYGSLCKFTYGELQVRVTKNLFVIVSDGHSQDALPINFVSQQLVDRIVDELSKKWWAATTHGEQK